MKTGACVLVAVSIISYGLYDCLKIKKTTVALEEILSLINIFKNELNYRKSSYSELIATAKKQGFHYINLADERLSVSCLNPCIISEFDVFFESIGTTDVDGQINICDEYIEKFKSLLDKQKCKEESKIQVNLSLSLLGALSVIVIFI